MELKCPRCDRPLWASGTEPQTGLGLDRYRPSQVPDEQPAPIQCPHCSSQLPVVMQGALLASSVARWIPDSPAPSKGEALEDPFPGRLAEPLPAPGYPDRRETRDRFTAEIQAQHQQVLAGRPHPTLLGQAPGPLAGEQTGPRDPLGSTARPKPTMAELTEQATAFPTPALGSPRHDENEAEPPGPTNNGTDDTAPGAQKNRR